MKKTILITTLVLLLATAVLFLPSGIAPNVVGDNYLNVTVHTSVNITNAKPEVLNVSVYDASNFSLKNITVVAGGLKTVFCNATVRDWNGFNDMILVNASLWHSSSTVDASDDNSSHYTNYSCTLNNSLSAYVGEYVCSFTVLYYSTNGTWNCNVSVMDNYNMSGSAYNSTVFYPVYALNVTDGIDFGNVAVESYSSDVSANLTNLGNMGINVTVEGYGVTRGDGLAMSCSVNGNISVSNERFALGSGVAFGSKTSLTGGSDLISGLTMPKQTVPATQVVNETFWQLYIPPNPAGNCSGYILFTALAE
jgi:hypothetical protein